MSAEIVRNAIRAAGGQRRFVEKMGRGSGAEDSIRLILSGGRVPSETFRADMIRASNGMLTHEDIIAITGKSQASSAGPKIDSHWDADEDVRRNWIISRAAKAARKQRLANKALSP